MNKNSLILLDLFSGIGGFALGLQNAGFKFEKHYFSEIDKQAIANYQYNFKESNYAGDIRTIHKGSIPRADIITFGSPCQDFSMAGKRSGMEGQRSSLVLEAIRLIAELRPSLFMWENVKGTFSSNGGSDFWAIIRAFADIGGYELEWQLVNTSWILPQNRERIYLIGHLTGVSRPQVFPIRESNIGTTQRQSVTPNIRTITGGGNSGGHHSGMTLIKQLNDKRNFGKSTKQQDRVYDPSGLMATLGSHRLECKVNILTNTKAGVEELEIGDSLNFSVPTSKTRRGRIGKGISNTLDTQCNQGTLVDSNIRRLTEIECERLQGFPDDWTKFGNYEGVVKEISKTQRYKMIGNAVTAKMVELIANKLIKSQ